MKVDYRKIYEQHFGTIPLDEKGRTFEIHHVDGNRKNNDPKNLVALSIVDHFWVHWTNGDYGACRMIARKMKVSPEILSDLSKRVQAERIEKGTHHLLGGEIQRKSNQKRLKDGTHHLLGPSTNKQLIETGQHPSQNPESVKKIKQKALERVEKGTHIFCDSEWQSEQGKKGAKKQLEEGKHPSQIRKECPWCGVECSSSNYARWHGDNCRSKSQNDAEEFQEWLDNDCS